MYVCSYALRPPSCPDHDRPLSDPTGAGSDRHHHDHDRALSDPGRHHLQQLGGLVDQLGLLLQLRHPDHHRLRRHGARKQVRLTLQVRSGQVSRLETGQRQVRDRSEIGQRQVRDRSAGQKQVRDRSETGQRRCRSGQVRHRSETGQARCWPGQVRSGQVRSGQVRSGQVSRSGTGQTCCS